MTCTGVLCLTFALVEHSAPVNNNNKCFGGTGRTVVFALYIETVVLQCSTSILPVR